MKKFICIILLVITVFSVISCKDVSVDSIVTDSIEDAETVDETGYINEDGNIALDNVLAILPCSTMLFKTTFYKDGTFEGSLRSPDRSSWLIKNRESGLFTHLGTGVSIEDDHISPYNHINAITYDAVITVKGVYTVDNDIYTLKIEHIYQKADNIKGENAERFINNLDNIKDTLDNPLNDQTKSLFRGEWAEFSDSEFKNSSVITAKLVKRGDGMFKRFWFSLTVENKYSEYADVNRAMMPVKMELDFTSGNKGKEIIEFNDDLYKKTDKIYYCTGELAIDYSYTYEYDENGAPLSVQRVDLLTGDTAVNKLETYEYYPDGSLKISRRPDDSVYSEYFYYDNGRIKSKISYSRNSDGTYEKFQEFEYFENTPERRTKKALHYEDGGITVVTEYDETGNKISTEKYDSDGNLVSTEAQETKKEENGNEVIYDYYDNGVAKSVTQYKNGKLFQITEYYDNGLGKTLTEYDSDGNATRSLVQTYTKEYYETGALSKITEKVNDVIYSVTELYPTGIIKSYESYQNGVIDHKRDYYEDGTEKIYYGYDNGKLDYIIDCYEDGRRKSYTSYNSDGTVREHTVETSWSVYSVMSDDF